MAKEISVPFDLVKMTKEMEKVRAEFSDRYEGMSHEERVEKMLLDIMCMLYVELYMR